MASTHYYDKIKNLQDTRHENEKQRMELEGRLNSYVKSDDRLTKLKAVRLQSYWKKLCEDEERSRRRNEQLLREFDRVEAHMAVLAERTQRQQRIKEDYEDYVERMYPNWKQKVMAQSVGVYNAALHPGPLLPAPQSQPATKHFMQFSNGSTSTAGLQPQYVAVPNVQDTPTPENLLSRYHAVSGYNNGGQTSTGANNRDDQLQGSDRYDWSYTDYPQDAPMSPGEFLPQGLLQTAPPIPHSGSQWLRKENPLIPSSDYQATTSVGTQSKYATQTLENTTVQARFPVDVPAAKPDTTPSVVAAAVTDRPVVDPDSFPSSSVPQIQPQDTREDSAVSDSNSQGKLTTHHSLLTHNEPLSRKLPENEVLSDDDVALLRGASTSSTRSKHSRNSRSLGGRSKAKLHDVTPKDLCNDLDDYDNVGADDYTTVLRAESRSGDSLVQSDSQRFIVQPDSDVSEDVEVDVVKDRSTVTVNQRSSVSMSLHSRTLPQPDLTLDGFYNLLVAIQDDLPRTTSPEAYYRTLPTASSVKKEIIFNANKGALLSHVDSTSISMVVKDQLPLLAANCETGALLPDKLFITSKNIESVLEETVRTFIHPTCRPFWDMLYEHMILLRGHDIMSAKQVAVLFAELIISEDSRYEEKAQRLLTSLLVGVDVIQSPGSTSTFVSPRRPEVGVTSVDVVDSVSGNLEHDDDADDDDDDVDDFFNQPLPGKSVGSLKDSALYKQVKDEALVTQSQKSQDFEDDEFGDIDDMLSPHGTGQQMYNTTECEDTMSPRSTHDSEATLPHSLGTTLPHSLGTTGGYIPSGLESTGGYDTGALGSTGGYLPSGLDTGNSKSTDKSAALPRATSKNTNRAAFRFGSSDDESEVEIPSSKTTPRGPTVDEDDDDEFEFYT